jgi:quinol monooxygenase YgiN
MILLEITFKIAETELGNFTDAAREVARASKAENGCKEYVFSTDLDVRTTFYLLEQWESEEALQRHYQSPHFAKFAAYLGSISCERIRRAQIGDLRAFEMKPRSA